MKRGPRCKATCGSRASQPPKHNVQILICASALLVGNAASGQLSSSSVDKEVNNLALQVFVTSPYTGEHTGSSLAGVTSVSQGVNRAGLHYTAYPDLSGTRPGHVLGYQLPAARLEVVADSGFGSGINRLIQVGVGIDLLPGRDALYPWRLPDQMPADAQVGTEAGLDTLGASGNVDVRFCVSERQRVGVSYRTPLNIDYRGDSQANNRPAMGGGVFNTELMTHVTYPTVVSASYGIDLNERAGFEANVDWLHYSRFRDLPLMAVNDMPGMPATVNEDWRDTFSLGFSGLYRLSQHVIARAGYQFYRSPLGDSGPGDATMADQNIMSFALEFTSRNHSLVASYAADFYDLGLISSRRGGANSAMHLASFAYRLVF